MSSVGINQKRTSSEQLWQQGLHKLIKTAFSFLHVQMFAFLAKPTWSMNDRISEVSSQIPRLFSASRTHFPAKITDLIRCIRRYFLMSTLLKGLEIASLCSEKIQHFASFSSSVRGEETKALILWFCSTCISWTCTEEHCRLQLWVSFSLVGVISVLMSGFCVRWKRIKDEYCSRVMGSVVYVSFVGHF